ncbi:MAG: HupE/UreJ family protein [Polyangiaceae bacterium]
MRRTPQDVETRSAHGRRRVIPCFALAVAVALLCVLTPTRAHAHKTSRSYCSVQTVPGGIDVVVEIGGPHLAPILGLAENPPPDDTLLEAKTRLMQQLEDRVQPRTPTGPCSMTPGELRLVDLDGERAVSATLHYDCDGGPVTLRDTLGFDVDPRTEILCVLDGSAWVFRLGSEERELGTPPTLGAVLVSFVRSGALHVLAGLDHVLFVFALLLAAARSARDQTFRRGLRHMTLIVTGFTLGHSLTLLAAGLGLVQVSSRLTESLIALSIVVVGVENVLRETPGMRVVTAAAFGLVHGFGFASVLAETELPSRGRVGALLCFNLGIELAQLAIVALVFPLLWRGAKQPWYERVLARPVSLSVAALALLWFVKRAFALDVLPWLGG